MTCKRRHVSTGVAVMDTIAGKEHFLYGWKYGHVSGGAGFEFPGGKVNPGESIEACAVREVFEETGLLIEPHFLGCHYEFDFAVGDGNLSFLCVMFAGIPIDGTLELKEPTKHREWRWFPADEVPMPLILHARGGLLAMSEMYHERSCFHQVRLDRH